MAVSDLIGPSAPIQASVHSPLERRFGTWGLSVHYVASVLGAGILILPGIALQTSGPGSILAWAILIAFSYALAWTLAKLSVRYPDCRGLPLFIRHGFGAAWERGAGLLLALAVAAGIVPSYAIAAARRLASLGVVPPEWSLPLVGLIIVGGAVAVGLAGLRLGAQLQMVLVGVVAGVLLLTIILALPQADVANLSAPIPNGWQGIGMAVALCFYGIIGWDNAASLAEEVRDPVRTMPRAAMLGVTMVGVLYLAFATTLVLTVPATSSDAALSPVAAMLAKGVGDQGEQVGHALSLMLIVLATNAWVLSGSRLLCGLSRQGILPRRFCVLTRGSRTPARAYLLLGLTAVLVLGLAHLAGWAEYEIISLVSSTFLVLYVLVVLAAFRLLPKAPDRVVAVLTLLVLLVMASFYAAATALTAALLALVVGVQRFGPTALGRRRAGLKDSRYL
jgi:amino acid efflux transporter